MQVRALLLVLSKKVAKTRMALNEVAVLNAAAGLAAMSPREGEEVNKLVQALRVKVLENSDLCKLLRTPESKAKAKTWKADLGIILPDGDKQAPAPPKGTGQKNLADQATKGTVTSTLSQQQSAGAKNVASKRSSVGESKGSARKRKSGASPSKRASPVTGKKTEKEAAKKPENDAAKKSENNAEKKLETGAARGGEKKAENPWAAWFTKS